MTERSETVRMAVNKDVFVDDDGRKSVEGYWVVEIEDDGSVCGVASGTKHPTREGAEKEMADLNRSADRKMPEHGTPKLIEVSKVQELISIFREALEPFPAARVAGVTFQTLDRLPPEKRKQWTSERPLDAVPASVVGLDEGAADQAEEPATKPRMRP
ncbi:hypothetical protein WJ74_11230 [Burkholderia ubonensis]|nr:hypothetical protein WJ74_11230 [Burkholderia ubonensis]